MGLWQPIPLKERLYDVFFLVGFVMLFLIAVFIDPINAFAPVGTQCGGKDAVCNASYSDTWGVNKEYIANSVWPGRFLSNAYFNYCIDYDQLGGRNPAWLRATVIFDILMFPIYIFGFYSFLHGIEACRTILLCWSSAMLYGLFIILSAELLGEFKSSDTLSVLGFMGFYVVFPLILMWRLRNRRVFSERKELSSTPKTKMVLRSRSKSRRKKIN